MAIAPGSLMLHATYNGTYIEVRAVLRNTEDADELIRVLATMKYLLPATRPTPEPVDE